MLNWFLLKSQSKNLGQLGEEFAQEEYKVRGFKIIAANFFNKKGLRLGEIDFIALGKNEIIFVEVKTRNTRLGKFGGGAEAVDIYKQRKILKAVKVFLLANSQYQVLRPQIDVCVLESSGLDKPAFYAKIISNAVEDWN